MAVSAQYPGPVPPVRTEHPALAQQGRFGWALASALLVQAVLLLVFLHFANEVGPVLAKHKSVMKIHVIAPPPPKPIPKPPPPKPLPPPPPKVVTPPKPPPPPPPKPIPRPKPRPIVHPKPVPHVAAPPPPPPPPPQPQISAAQQADATELYAARVHAAVQDDLHVPEQVAMMHLRGITTLAITIAPSGALLGVSVARSSGAPPIDQAALAAVRATRFPPFTAKMPHHAVTFDLQVKLRGG
ncbi:MAG TPA: energy transducer TonB [Acidiphilium sp.]|nr:energy transducer TonB [Acidiphilium sp.]HQU23565.1 energy transducer TonB [Acidiphilium sp.]